MTAVTGAPSRGWCTSPCSWTALPERSLDELAEQALERVVEGTDLDEAGAKRAGHFRYRDGELAGAAGRHRDRRPVDGDGRDGVEPDEGGCELPGARGADEHPLGPVGHRVA